MFAYISEGEGGGAGSYQQKKFTLYLILLNNSLQYLQYSEISLYQKGY